MTLAALTMDSAHILKVVLSVRYRRKPYFRLMLTTLCWNGKQLRPVGSAKVSAQEPSSGYYARLVATET